MVVTSYGRNKNRDDGHSRISPDVHFNKFSLTKKKLDLERTISELVEPFLKKSDQKIKKKTENQCQNAACRQKTTSENLVATKKLGLE